MKLHALGHSSYILEMRNSDDESVRILADPWITDYVIGDLMARFPRIRIDYERLPEIHGIFLSHAHTDHFCPYSLIELWRELPNAPVILLPQSLAYLQELLHEHLEECSIFVLEQGEAIDFFGLSLSALFNLERRPTNEDDVMMLVVESEQEVFFSECDALLPFYDEAAREAISTYLGGEGQGLDTAVFLTTKNELGATMASFNAKSLEDRATFVAGAEDKINEEIEEIYTPMPHLYPDLWQNERLVRLIGGQGIAFPTRVNPDFNRVLFPVRLADRVEMEREAADEQELLHQIDVFEPGFIHELSDGELVDRERCPYLELLDDESDREFDGELEVFDTFPIAPLRSELRDFDPQEQRILAMLNERFLPYLIGRREPPIEHLLADVDECTYVVRVRYGNAAEWEDRDYEITFGDLRFTRESTGGTADEFYWANDLEDYLTGRCDDFSTFCRAPLPGTARRFWDALGMPFLNNDLVVAKMRFHFERAAEGRTPEEWVLPFYDVPPIEEEDGADDEDDEDEALDDAYEGAFDDDEI
ncbi:MAG: MBL fold metallo-hydrolase [Planctomycetes bacterium]|nr:MBL fold metallo-hydrolase [Planctomycetota bacterium]